MTVFRFLLAVSATALALGLMFKSDALASRVELSGRARDHLANDSAGSEQRKEPLQVEKSAGESKIDPGISGTGQLSA